VAHQHFPRSPVSDVAIGIVDDAHLDARHGPPEGAGADLARLDGIAQHANHLRHSPQLDHGEAETLLERRVQFGLDAGADAEPDLVLPFVLGRRELQQHRRDHAEIVDDGRTGLGDLLPPALGMEAIRLDLAIAGHDGAHQRHDTGIRVIERQRVVDAILGLAQAGDPAERGVPGADAIS
jgi:hypothetical protein